MIVKYLWTTENKKRFPSGMIYEHKTKLWEGWFLFGFIPLYIRNYKIVVIK